MERAGFHRYGLPRRVLPEISPLSQFLSGLRAGALFQSVARRGRIRRAEVPAQRIPAAQRVLKHMLRLPLQLTADLTRARLARMVRLAPDAGPVQFVDAAEVLHHDSSHPVSHERIREINSSRSPVVWIGRSEPLRRAGISRLVRAITQTGTFVFLETDGTLLRRRIHEFQPVSRLFLTFRLEPSAQRSASERLRPGVF